MKRTIQGGTKLAIIPGMTAIQQVGLRLGELLLVLAILWVFLLDKKKRNKFWDLMTVLVFYAMGGIVLLELLLAL